MKIKRLYLPNSMRNFPLLLKEKENISTRMIYGKYLYCPDTSSASPHLVNTMFYSYYVKYTSH